jgi:tripartite-type tricarboxylate transporter receptor subunit TctC
MPADKVQMLRSAFEQVTKDPAFIEDAARQHMEIDPLSGVEIEAMLAKIYATPTDVVDRARAILRVGKGLTTTK